MKEDLKKLSDLMNEAKKMSVADGEIVDLLNSIPEKKRLKIMACNMAILEMIEKDKEIEKKMDTMQFFNVVFLGVCKDLGIIKINK